MYFYIANHNIKTMDKQNFCKSVVSEQKVVDIWCQYKNPMILQVFSDTSIHFGFPLEIFYDDVTLNNAGWVKKVLLFDKVYMFI